MNRFEKKWGSLANIWDLHVWREAWENEMTGKVGIECEGSWTKWQMADIQYNGEREISEE